ncbi:acyl-CoA dehydrogenase family protein [Uliginosibacterium sp. H1]|uniref:acyl-CoA dehydrogenase family protein n=1 Tax=Uliginosibacterium sp. H1 TaxID=3114757 RepID=UPI002E1839F4|nr:acyl-CoA dehydrogenase family protein [Uliginosibacterium sp. H1]
MRSVHLTPLHDAFREEVSAFFDQHLRPFAEVWEMERCIPRSAWRKFGEHGLLGLAHGPAHGGSARDIFHSVVFLEELGRTGYAGVRAGISLHAYMATHYLARHASDELRRAYLAPSIRGDRIAALAITERDAGSDLSRLATTAMRDGGDYIVDGGKVFITNGANADYYVVAVRTATPVPQARRANTGISLLIVDSRLPGVQITRQEKLGWHAAATAELHFDKVRVPADRLIGRENSGFMYLMRGFQLERLVAAALAVGGAEHCLDTTLAHVTSRQAFDGKLSNLQAIRHRLADMTTELAGARAFTYHAAWCYAQDELSVTECSMAKLLTTELACRIADNCLQLQGARGYLADSDIARMHRDARAGTMAGGATEVMRDIIAQQLIDLGPSRASPRQAESSAKT